MDQEKYIEMQPVGNWDNRPYSEVEAYIKQSFDNIKEELNNQTNTNTSTLWSTVEGHTTAIGSLGSSISHNTSQITAINNKVGDRSDQIGGTIGNMLDSIGEAIGTDSTPGSIMGRITASETSISGINTTIDQLRAEIGSNSDETIETTDSLSTRLSTAEGKIGDLEFWQGTTNEYMADNTAAVGVCATDIMELQEQMTLVAQRLCGGPASLDITDEENGDFINENDITSQIKFIGGSDCLNIGDEGSGLCSVRLDDIEQNIRYAQDRINSNNTRITGVATDVNSLTITVGNASSGLVKTVNDLESNLTTLTSTVDARETNHRLVPTATSYDAGFHLVVNSSGVPAWQASTGGVSFTSQSGSPINIGDGSGTNTWSVGLNYDSEYFTTSQNDNSQPQLTLSFTPQHLQAAQNSGITISSNNISIDDSVVVTHSDLTSTLQGYVPTSTLSSYSTSADISGTYARQSYLNTELSKKQDTISDLITIRSNAGKGATALQPGDMYDSEGYHYTDLRLMANDGQLTPGATYCMTDYITPTSHVDQRLYLTALTTNMFSPDGLLEPKSGENGGCPYKVKYNICKLDSDYAFYDWMRNLNDEQHRGVIYYMEDIYGNITPYDYTNVEWYWGDQMTSTFGRTDENQYLFARGNVIKPYYEKVYDTSNHRDILVQKLNKIHLGGDAVDNVFGDGCHDIYLGNEVRCSTFERGCYDIQFWEADFSELLIGYNQTRYNIAQGGNVDVSHNHVITADIGYGDLTGTDLMSYTNNIHVKAGTNSCRFLTTAYDGNGTTDKVRNITINASVTGVGCCGEDHPYIYLPRKVHGSEGDDCGYYGFLFEGDDEDEVLSQTEGIDGLDCLDLEVGMTSHGYIHVWCPTPEDERTWDGRPIDGGSTDDGGYDEHLGENGYEESNDGPEPLEEPEESGDNNGGSEPEPNPTEPDGDGEEGSGDEPNPDDPNPDNPSSDDPEGGESPEEDTPEEETPEETEIIPGE